MQERIIELNSKNLLYNLNIIPERTEHLDIEGEMPLLHKIGYVLLSLLYF